MRLPKVLDIKKYSSGITLIEILIVLGIAALLLGAGAPVAYNFYYQAQFESEYSLLFSTLQQARNLSLVNHNKSAHGVYLESETFITFQGSSFAARTASQDREFPRATQVTISGPVEIVFAALSGETSSSTFSVSNGDRSRDIFVNAEGLVYEPNY
ncbi:MAG: prepilin-type N-terminal cleavage/methylation domain-containing protein [Patescibacteria group bacterium]